MDQAIRARGIARFLLKTVSGYEKSYPLARNFHDGAEDARSF